MFEIRRRVEQLEIIAQLLDQNTASSARLAVILADNLAEIIMHGRARLEFAKDQHYQGFRPVRWSPTKRHEVMEEFRPKVNFLHNDLGLVDADDAAFLKFGHSVRNRAYHADTYHADVIETIARTYFGKVCRLYPRLRPPGGAFANTQVETDFLQRHGMSDPMDLINGGLERICENLVAPRACPVGDLAAGLSKNLVRRIETIIGNRDEHGYLETLLDGQAEGDVAQKEVLKQIQFADRFEPDTGAPDTDEAFRTERERWEREFAAYQPDVTLAKLRRWAVTARSIYRETVAGNAAERFRTVDEQFSPVEELVHQAVREFDEWVNSEVKRLCAERI